MSLPLTKKSIDHSNTEQFVFSFFCDLCGDEWKSPAILFETGGFTVVEHEVTQQLIWEQEHRAAFDRANLQAHFHFSYCSGCGKWVCDECFDVEGSGKNGICRDCCKNK